MNLLPNLIALCLAFPGPVVTEAPIFLAGETVLFQGDSITDGNRGRNDDPNHILGHGYVFNIASQYGAAFPELNLKFVNRGVSGDTVEDLASRWKKDALDVKPDALSVLIGINDVFAARTKNKPLQPERLYQTYDRLLADSVKGKPKVKLVLCEPFALPVGMAAKDYSAWKADVATLAGIVDRLAAKYKVPVVRFQQAFDEAAKQAPASYWIWDGVHPTYSGHQLMANAWVKAYREFYIPAIRDPLRNSAIAPEVNFERDFYNWLHRHADVLALQAKGNPDVVLVGDSITHCWGGTPTSNRVNGAESWTETFGDLKVINMGFGWDRTQNVLWRLQKGEVSGISPKAIVLNIGTNNLVGDDTARENTPEETAVGVEAIVTLLRQRAPQSKLFVMGVFPRGLKKDNPLDQKITKLNALLAKSLAGIKGVTFLDIGAKLREPDGSISAKNFPDGTHPAESAYRVWGQALRDAEAIPQKG